MTYDEFVAEYNEKTFNYDNAADVQCFDVARVYLEKVFGIEPFSVISAKNYFIRFEQFEQLEKNFVKIFNTPDFIPMKGDICVWGSGVSKGNGHVSIATGEGTAKYFYGYDMKRNGRVLKRTRHNYRYFLGVLRAKDKSLISEKFANWQ